MKKEEIRQSLIAIFEEVGMVEPEEFMAGQPLAELFDSLTQIEIYNEIDDRYPLDVEFEEVLQMETFEHIVEFIFEKLKEQGS